LIQNHCLAYLTGPPFPSPPHDTLTDQVPTPPGTECPESQSVDPVLELFSAAHSQQTALSWENFLRGRISTLWDESVFHAHMAWHQWANKHIWPTKAVHAVLAYSFSLWKIQCALIPGHTLDESRNLVLHIYASKPPMPIASILMIHTQFPNLFDNNIRLF
jgi:hypothetical protein